MPLVEYSSSSSDDDDPASPPSKKRRTARAGGADPPLPPLPPAFHDLYASTVRTTTRDDPSLHQGRTRQNPHVAGVWPSHVYVEWHPPPDVHALLAGLVSALQDAVVAATSTTDTNSTTTTENTKNNKNKINSLLTSDLNAPLPLHISLSRPLSLTTDAKDAFLRELEDSVRASGIAPFWLRCTGAEWHHPRAGESGRSFLVLRVRSCSTSTAANGNVGEGDDAGPGPDGNPNPELTEVLRRCNAVAARFGQPGLYEWAGAGVDGGGGVGVGARQVGEAFHLSVAWSLGEPGEEVLRSTKRIFGEPAALKRLREVQVPVEGVKVKIGNVITHVELRRPGDGRKGGKNLLGL